MRHKFSWAFEEINPLFEVEYIKYNILNLVPVYNRNQSNW